MLKEQAEVLVRENTILKRAVAIQHERQKEYDERNQEVQHMKQMIAQYQEHLKNLEVKLKRFSLVLCDSVCAFIFSLVVCLKEIFVAS